jgi:hypothetical protein
MARIKRKGQSHFKNVIYKNDMMIESGASD